MIAYVRGRLAAKSADRVVVETAGGVGYEIVVPLGVMERLPGPGTDVTLATELVVREDGWALYGFLDAAERRFFQRLTTVSGVGPKLAVALMSALGVERGARAVREKNIALLSSVSGIGRKTAERLALELSDKVDEFVEAPAGGGGGGRSRQGRKPRSRRSSGSATPPLRPTAPCGARCPAMAAATSRARPRRWCGVPCRFSPPNDARGGTDNHRRMDLHALRGDQPQAGARDREAGR